MLNEQSNTDEYTANSQRNVLNEVARVGQHNVRGNAFQERGHTRVRRTGAHPVALEALERQPRVERLPSAVRFDVDRQSARSSHNSTRNTSTNQRVAIVNTKTQLRAYRAYSYAIKRSMSTSMVPFLSRPRSTHMSSSAGLRSADLDLRNWASMKALLNMKCND